MKKIAISLASIVLFSSVAYSAMVPIGQGKCIDTTSMLIESC